jgi:hypothetical protein
MTSRISGPEEARPLRVLLVATDEADVERFRDLVTRMPAHPEVDWARSFETGYNRMIAGRTTPTS